MRCEPADKIIKDLGGLSAVAKVTGVTPHSVMRWRTPTDDGGTGGLIPFKHVPALLTEAKGRGIELTANDFLPKPKPSRRTSKQEVAV